MSNEQRRKHKREKNLLNVREFHKALSAILGNGVAVVDDEGNQL